MAVLTCIKAGRYDDFLKSVDMNKEEKDTLTVWIDCNNRLVSKFMLTVDISKRTKLTKEWDDLKVQLEGVPDTYTIIELQCVVVHNILLGKLLTSCTNVKPFLSDIETLLETHLSKVCGIYGLTIPQIDRKMSVLCDIILTNIKHFENIKGVFLLLYDCVLIMMAKANSSDASHDRKKTTCILQRLQEHVLRLQNDKDSIITPVLCLAPNTEKPEINFVLPDLIMKLLCIRYFQCGQYTSCMDILGVMVIKEELSPEFMYMKAWVSWCTDQCIDCMEISQKLLSRGGLAKKLIAKCHNLIGCCLVKQNKPHCAIQQFQLALNSDFTFLMPLYNISLQYRHSQLHDAELEALNLIVMILERQKNGSSSSLLKGITSEHLTIFSTNDQINLPQALYILSRRCKDLQKYEHGAKRYKDLIEVFRSCDSLEPGSDDFIVPEIEQVYCEAAFCLLSAEQYGECIDMCDKVLEVFEDTKNIDTSTVSSRDDEDDFMSIFSDEPFVSLEVKKEIKRKRAQNSESPGNNLNMYRMLLYKAESLLHTEQLEEALNCLNRLTGDVEENIEMRFQQRQKKFKEEGYGICSDDEQTLLQTAYLNKAVVLTAMRKFRDAIHSSRLAVQYNKGNNEAMYTHTLVLIKMDREQEASAEWLDYRKIEIRQNQEQIQQILVEKLVEMEKTNRKSGSKQDKNELYTQMDILCLKQFMQGRESV